MNQLISVFSSIRLTVVLLFLGIVLIFFGTLDQVHIGIRGAQEQYFESLLAFWRYPLQWPLGDRLHWVTLPVPGGYLIGPLLVVNLICAHFRYFQPGWRKAGIVAIHAGVVLLLVSQFMTNILQEESDMWIREGERSNFMESRLENELVIIDTTDPERDAVISIPTDLIARQNVFQHPKLPFSISIREYYPNASITRRGANSEQPAIAVSRGVASETEVVVTPRPETSRLDERNAIAAVIELSSSGGDLGSWLVSNVFADSIPRQEFAYEGHTYEIALRFKRTYLPYTIELIDFTHDRYPGTEIPKNFASDVRIHNPAKDEHRQTKIYMNHPLRYEGLTFFQASFTKDDQASMFQVVRNPGWLIPYISCGLVTIGLILQFGVHLIGFASRKRV